MDDKWSVENRYSIQIAEPGNFDNRPAILLNRPDRLGLKPGPAMFAIVVLGFKWTEENPYPSIPTIAKKLGVYPRTAQRYRQTLIDKGYLKVNARYRNGKQTSNEYDLTGLIKAIDTLIDEDNIYSR